MVIKRIGDSFQYENMTYTIGQRIFANGQSDWEGLFGVITEIRTDGDKETENETPDIYCSFDVPVLPADVKELEERFSSLYQELKKLEDIGLDEVIMAPEMVEPLEPWADRKKKNVWAVVIDWSCHGEHGHLEEICTDYLDAKRKLTEYLTEEFDNSTLLQWQSDDRYATVSEKDSYECYEKEDYQNNHYHICLKEKAMVMEEMFIRETAQLYQQQLWREDILSRMMQCEACEGLSGWQYKRIEKESDMTERLEKQLGTNDSYWKAYWTSVEQVISKLVQKYTEDRPKCYDPETYNIYPLCSGNGGKQCSDCAFFVDLETGGV